MQIAQLLARLHERGLVHRDVRPESLRWLRSRDEWCLLNFGFSAKEGALLQL
jgi:serine/threonine protein kinase